MHARRCGDAASGGLDSSAEALNLAPLLKVVFTFFFILFLFIYMEICQSLFSSVRGDMIDTREKSRRLTRAELKAVESGCSFHWGPEGPIYRCWGVRGT